VRAVSSVGVALAVLVAGLFIGAGCAAGRGSHPAPFNVSVADAWARPGAAGDSTAVYMRLTNHGRGGEALVGGRTEVAQRVELHEAVLQTELRDGRPTQVMRMQQLPAVAVPAGSEVELRPGGLHIMLVGLERALAEGDSFALTLQFQDRDPVTVEVFVVRPDSATGHEGH